MFSDKLHTLNNLLNTTETRTIAINILKEYQDAIQVILTDTLQNDVNKFIGELTYDERAEVLKDAHAFSVKSTAIRMAQYGQQFFDSEITILLDDYNNGIYTNDEFKLRCSILDALKESLVEYGSSDISL